MKTAKIDVLMYDEKALNLIKNPPPTTRYYILDGVHNGVTMLV